jgi:hypothetical protein
VFGSKKRHVLEDGISAIGVVTNVEYAKLLGAMTVARNYNYKLDVTLMVRPDNDAPFEAHVSGYFSQYAQPSIGDQLWVRYDPEDRTKVEIDTAKIAADNAAVEAHAAEAAATELPADLAANGIPGRATLSNVQKSPVSNLVDCTLSLKIRLIDGTPPYAAECHVLVAPDKAERLIPGQTFLAVRADPNNRSRVAWSPDEQIPVVTITDPAVVDPPARALADGQPCRVTVLLADRQFLCPPGGDEFYAIKVRVAADGSEFQVNVPTPAAAVSLLKPGADLPAKRLVGQPNVLAIDWSAALAEHGTAVG